MDDDSVESEYPLIVTEILRRVLLCERELGRLSENPGKDENWVVVDIVTLQIRRCCEMLLLGSALAHLRDGHTSLDSKKWRPKDAFSELYKINEYPLPTPIELEFREHPSGVKQIMPASKPMPFSVLSSIYGQCGDLMHTPSADRVLRGKMSAFDIRKFSDWTLGLKRLIAGHVLLLPERKSILLCLWNGNEQDRPSIFMMESEGPSTFAIDDLPDFEMLAA